MRFFNKHSVNTTVQSNSKVIILLSTLVSVLLATPTATTRFKEYKQHWRFSRNTEPDWKVQYDTTTGTSTMASDTNKEVVKLFQGRKSESGGADIKTSQNNGTNTYWEIIVDNAGGRRNVSGVRRSEVDVGMDKPLAGINASDEEDTTKDQMQIGHVGLKIDVRGDDKETRNKEQEPTTSRGIKEVFQQFYDVASYFTGLLDFEDYIEDRTSQKKKRKMFFQKMLLPLLIVAKLKIIMMFPILIAAMVLLVGSTGMAGFFFALFTAAVTHNK